MVHIKSGDFILDQFETVKSFAEFMELYAKLSPPGTGANPTILLKAFRRKLVTNLEEARDLYRLSNHDHNVLKEAVAFTHTSDEILSFTRLLSPDDQYSTSPGDPEGLDIVFRRLDEIRS